jgi:hypothetical protein
LAVTGAAPNPATSIESVVHPAIAVGQNPVAADNIGAQATEVPGANQPAYVGHGGDSSVSSTGDVAAVGYDGAGGGLNVQPTVPSVVNLAAEVDFLGQVASGLSQIAQNGLSSGFSHAEKNHRKLSAAVPVAAPEAALGTVADVPVAAPEAALGGDAAVYEAALGAVAGAPLAESEAALRFDAAVPEAALGAVAGAPVAESEAALRFDAAVHEAALGAVAGAPLAESEAALRFYAAVPEAVFGAVAAVLAAAPSAAHVAAPEAALGGDAAVPEAALGAVAGAPVAEPEAALRFDAAVPEAAFGAVAAVLAAAPSAAHVAAPEAALGGDAAVPVAAPEAALSGGAAVPAAALVNAPVAAPGGGQTDVNSLADAQSRIEKQTTTQITLAPARDGNSAEPLKIQRNFAQNLRGVVEVQGYLQIETGVYMFITTGPSVRKLPIITADYESEFEDFAHQIQSLGLILEIHELATELNFSHFGFLPKPSSLKRKCRGELGESGGSDRKRRKQ